jgi:hypothetical protein
MPVDLSLTVVFQEGMTRPVAASCATGDALHQNFG